MPNSLVGRNDQLISKAFIPVLANINVGCAAGTASKKPSNLLTKKLGWFKDISAVAFLTASSVGNPLTGSK